MSAAIVVLNPPGKPQLSPEALFSASEMSASFQIAQGELDAFWHDAMVGVYLDAGAYVVAEFADEADAFELQHRLAAARRMH